MRSPTDCRQRAVDTRASTGLLLASLQCCIKARYWIGMPSIGFLAQKGGAGKTTLAVHLTVLASDALLVDLDPQRSAAEWWETRSAELPELAIGQAKDLQT